MSANVWHPLILKRPDGWRGTVDDQNELFTYILARYMWLRVAHTIPVRNVTLDKWRTYAPQYLPLYWGSMVKTYGECIDIFGKTCTYTSRYVPAMAIYDWEALHAVAVMQMRYGDEDEKHSIPRGITLDYQWDVLNGVAVMRVQPEQFELREHVLQCMGRRYIGVSELLDYVFILDDTPEHYMEFKDQINM